MCPSENITIPADLEINRNNLQSYGEYFTVNIKVTYQNYNLWLKQLYIWIDNLLIYLYKINDYLNAYLKCKIVPIDTNKLWEKFAVFNKTI